MTITIRIPPKRPITKREQAKRDALLRFWEALNGGKGLIISKRNTNR